MYLSVLKTKLRKFYMHNIRDGTFIWFILDPIEILSAANDSSYYKKFNKPYIYIFFFFFTLNDYIKIFLLKNIKNIKIQ